jgi:hypothetical protein
MVWLLHPFHFVVWHSDHVPVVSAQYQQQWKSVQQSGCGYQLCFTGWGFGPGNHISVQGYTVHLDMFFVAPQGQGMGVASPHCHFPWSACPSSK